jgi:hypothetical protein
MVTKATFTSYRQCDSFCQSVNTYAATTVNDLTVTNTLQAVFV